MPRSRQVLTYGELGRLIGYTHVGVIGNVLGPIMAYCERENLPPLTSIVVNEKTGKPGGRIQYPGQRLNRKMTSSTTLGRTSTRRRKASCRRAAAASI